MHGVVEHPTTGRWYLYDDEEEPQLINDVDEFLQRADTQEQVYLLVYSKRVRHGRVVTASELLLLSKVAAAADEAAAALFQVRQRYAPAFSGPLQLRQHSAARSSSSSSSSNGHSATRATQRRSKVRSLRIVVRAEAVSRPIWTTITTPSETVDMLAHHSVHQRSVASMRASSAGVGRNRFFLAQQATTVSVATEAQSTSQSTGCAWHCTKARQNLSTDASLRALVRRTPTGKAPTAI
jgi:hypothetical protein